MSGVPLAITLVAGWYDGAAIRTGRGLARVGDASLLLPSGHADLEVWGAGELLAEEEVAHRSPGCPCCAVRLDLIDRIGRLARRRHAPARLVVALAPGSDLATAVVTLLEDPLLRRRCRLDGILTCIPGPRLAPSLAVLGEWPTAELLDAVLLADVVWVHDAAALTEQGRARVREAIRSVNPTARTSMAGTPPLHSTLDLHSWTPAAAMRRVASATSEVGGATGSRAWTGTAVLASDRPLDPDRLGSFFRTLHGSAGARLLRVDAVLDVAGEEHQEVTVGCRTSLRSRRGNPWCTAKDRRSLVRVVGRELDLEVVSEALDASVA